jgi:hypothetical protein
MKPTICGALAPACRPTAVDEEPQPSMPEKTVESGLAGGDGAAGIIIIEEFYAQVPPAWSHGYRANSCC